jgi:predicted nuclease of predicted toxin-antitoxin system
MKLLANENIPLKSVEYLRNKGYDVLYIGKDYSGIKDLEIIQLAIDQKRAIITFDRDYGELIFKQGLKPPEGILYLRITEYTPDLPGKIIHRLIQEKKIQFERRLSVVDNESIRQRKY